MINNMAFNDYNGNMQGGSQRQRDLVLAINEYCYLQSKTDGSIKSYVGPMTMTIGAQEALVYFDSKTKRFVETTDFEVARQLFTSAPEGWYAIMKNPTADGTYPTAGKANNSPANLNIGTKINIPGPVTFALFPGQMTKVVRGHKLRSNQYLIARVYDAESAMKNTATMLDAEGNAVEKKDTYFVGQLLVIKGTEISFYIPPSGIEVIAVDERKGEYIREAVTLERLEYAILKDESGEKRYCHGPAVVFPAPTETFVKAPKGGTIFRALELSPISGIYIKVIAEYEENSVKHPIGEELFITGKDQMIYYPRPEHAMIQYDGKYMHHAIAIPEGEGRYILDRLTGKIKTIKGPQMYLPDPRTEVVVKRQLSDKECGLLYPGNTEVLAYNRGITDEKISKMANRGEIKSITDAINSAYSTSNQEATLAIFEANANISRGVSYTKPRTITLDTKYDGVVSVDVWTGYAVNVISKSGKREVVVGPATRLLDYDETLEAVTLSTGTPKNHNNTINTAYLRVENNKVSDAITVQTKDFVNVMLNVSFCVNFLEKYKDKWFAVDNYIKLLCDRARSILKNEAKKYSIEEFYSNAINIVRKAILTEGEGKSKNEGRTFMENGMQVYDVEVLGIKVEESVAKIIVAHQEEMVRKALELSDAAKKMEVTTQLDTYAKETAKLTHETELYRLGLSKALEKEKADAALELAEAKRQMEIAKVQAEAAIQTSYDTIASAKLAREKAVADAEIAKLREQAQIEIEKNKAQAERIKEVMESITPELVAAMTSSANADLMETVTKSMAPYAIANGESVSDVTNRLLRGTPLEGLLQQLVEKK